MAAPLFGAILFGASVFAFDTAPVVVVPPPTPTVVPGYGAGGGRIRHPAQRSSLVVHYGPTQEEAERARERALQRQREAERVAKRAETQLEEARQARRQSEGKLRLELEKQEAKARSRARSAREKAAKAQAALDAAELALAAALQQAMFEAATAAEIPLGTTPEQRAAQAAAEQKAVLLAERARDEDEAFALILVLAGSES